MGAKNSEQSIKHMGCPNIKGQKKILLPLGCGHFSGLFVHEISRMIISRSSFEVKFFHLEVEFVTCTLLTNHCMYNGYLPR